MSGMWLSTCAAAVVQHCQSLTCSPCAAPVPQCCQQVVWPSTRLSERQLTAFCRLSSYPGTDAGQEGYLVHIGRCALREELLEALAIVQDGSELLPGPTARSASHFQAASLGVLTATAAVKG